MKSEIVDIISIALKEINEELDYESLNNISEETVIFGGDDGLDSLSLVRVITEVEIEINDKYDSGIVLASEKAMSMHNSPYRNVGTLADFAVEELKGASS